MLEFHLGQEINYLWEVVGGLELDDEKGRRMRGGEGISGEIQEKEPQCQKKECSEGLGTSQRLAKSLG